MRTTVRLDDALTKGVKKYAAERSLTLTAVIEEALKEKLARQEQEGLPRFPALRWHNPLAI
jgi:predicted transcriptional regulator